MTTLGVFLVLFSFNDPQEIREWFSINDEVMGGVSSGSFIQLEPGIAQFRGRVSFENKGGFASVRTRPLMASLAGYNGIEMRVRGDGKIYKLRLKTDSGSDGLCYEIPFRTEKERWDVVRLPFEKSKAKFRGLKIPLVPALNPGEIKSIGFLISDKQKGPFRLDVDWIKAYKSPEGALK